MLPLCFETYNGVQCQNDMSWASSTLCKSPMTWVSLKRRCRKHQHLIYSSALRAALQRRVSIKESDSGTIDREVSGVVLESKAASPKAASSIDEGRAQLYDPLSRRMSQCRSCRWRPGQWGLHLDQMEITRPHNTCVPLKGAVPYPSDSNRTGVSRHQELG